MRAASSVRAWVTTSLAALWAPLIDEDSRAGHRLGLVGIEGGLHAVQEVGLDRGEGGVEASGELDELALDDLDVPGDAHGPQAHNAEGQGPASEVGAGGLGGIGEELDDVGVVAFEVLDAHARVAEADLGHGWAPFRRRRVACPPQRVVPALVEQLRRLPASIDHAQPAGGGVDGGEQRAGHVGERHHGLARCERGEAPPLALVDPRDDVAQTTDDRLIGDLVQDVVVDQTEDLSGQVLRQLGDEGQRQPALPATFGDPGHLLEEYGHLGDAVGREELVGLFDDDKRLARLAGLATPLPVLVGGVLGPLDVAQHVGDDDVVDGGRVGARTGR